MDSEERYEQHLGRKRDTRLGMAVLAVLTLIVGIVVAITVEPAAGVVAFVILFAGGVVAVRASGDAYAGGPPGGPGL